MTNTGPYLPTTEAWVPPVFTFRHRHSEASLRELADDLHVKLAHTGQWKPLVTALEAAVTSPTGMAFIRGFPVEYWADAATFLTAILVTHAATKIQDRLEVAATRR